MKREQLLQYCVKHAIWVPKNAGVERIRAAIVRAYRHQSEGYSGHCVGYWGNDEPACMICKFEPICFECSMGVDKEIYFKEFKKLENPKVRFVEKKGKKK